MSYQKLPYVYPCPCGKKALRHMVGTFGKGLHIYNNSALAKTVFPGMRLPPFHRQYVPVVHHPHKKKKKKKFKIFFLFVFGNYGYIPAQNFSSPSLGFIQEN